MKHERHKKWETPSDPNEERPSIASLGPENHMTGPSHKPPNVTLLKVNNHWYLTELRGEFYFSCCFSFLFKKMDKSPFKGWYIIVVCL